MMLSLIIILLAVYSLISADPLEDLEWCKPLHWRSQPEELTALVSFPGSGNSWLRYLLQQVTGILTGSIYNDEELRRHGFPGEGISNGSVLVVKINDNEYYLDLSFKSVILLIRLPQDAILSEFHTINGGHFGFAPPSAFSKATFPLPQETLDWYGFVNTELSSWESLYMRYFNDYDGPMHVVFYEDLVRDLRRQLIGILNFLKYKFDESDLSCALEHKEGIYHRHKPQYLKTLSPYTLDMFRNITRVKKRVFAVAKKYIKQNRSRVYT